LLHETRTRRSRTEAESAKERERKAKKYELKNEQTPFLSPTSSLSLFLFPETFPSTRENGEQKRRNREEEEGNARAKKRVGGSAKTAVFFRALRVFGLSFGVLVCFVPRSSWELPSAQKLKNSHQKKIFATIASKPSGAQKREKQKEKSFSLISQASSSSLSTPSTRILPPASLSLLPRVNPVGYRWISLYKFCSTRSARKRSKGNFGSRSLLRGYEESAGGRG